MKNIVVLVSGGGTNLQRIIDSIENGEIPNAKIALVVADRECYGLTRAEKHHLPNVLIKRGKDFNEKLEKQLPEKLDLIVLAGFLSIIGKNIVQKFENKIINLHPSLLPKFGGKGMWGYYVHQAVLEAKEDYSGATVHIVTAGIDEGEIILQGKVPVEEKDTVDSLAAKVHLVEYDILPKAINKLLN